MRVLILLVFLVALPAFGEEPPASLSGKYLDDSLQLCRERTMGGLDLYSCEADSEGAVFLYLMESKGEPPDGRFVLDSFQTDPKAAMAELKTIASRCRELTMDGGLVDGYSATACIAYEVGQRNWEARRAKRLEAENDDR